MLLIGVAAALSLLTFVQSRLHCPIPPSQGRHGTCPDFWTRIGNSCYLLSTDLKTWEEAVNTCRFPGGDLVTVFRPVEHDELLLQAFQATSWIGLHFKDSSWQWSDGQPLLFTNWARGEPSDPENERCVEMMHWLGGQHGKWNDLNCNEYKRFICELDLEVECNRHSVCEWDGGDCYLKSPERGVGFAIASEVQETEDGFQVRLQHSGNGDMFGQTIHELMFEVTRYDETHVGFKIFDPNHPRYEPPVPLNLRVDEAAADYQYDVLLDSTTIGQPFHFKVIRMSSGAVMFDTSRSPLIFEDQFLQLTTSLPTTDAYGMGENVHESFLHDFDAAKVFPIFARDEPPTDGDKNAYGTHPFYEVFEEDGSLHGVLFFNSNPQEYTFFKEDGQIPSLTLRAIGGILDFHLFTGPTFDLVSQQYTEVIGRPMLPPYWSLGFQLSKWNYLTLDKFREVVERNRYARIPQDVQYGDIDYMDTFKIFTYNQQDWNGFPEYIRDIKQRLGMKFIPILDPALVIDFTDSYPPGKRGWEQDVFVKWPNSSFVPEDQPFNARDYMVGYVWPQEKTVFPDFMNPRTKEWFVNELLLFHDLLEFDGLWIDMNEPANFGTNQEKPWNWPEGQDPWSLKCPSSSYDYPPYRTVACNNGDQATGTIADKTICLVATHSDGSRSFIDYDVHNLYGWFHTLSAIEGARQATQKRSLVVTRSTFVSSGRYAGHWFGDNVSRWTDLRRSIILMFEFNMFGIPYGGSDICGYFDVASEELCLRWMQLGAFYPYSRNHNGNRDSDQDPAVWDRVAEGSRIALNIRYRFLPYLYTLFHRANSRGETVVRPLLAEFPLEQDARSIDHQFLWGSSMMIVPVLEPSNIRWWYVPNATWYNLHTGAQFYEVPPPHWSSMTVPDLEIPIFLRGGAIFPNQEPGINTVESRQNPMEFLVALDSSGSASGDFFWDDGDSIDTYENGLYHYATMTYSAGQFDFRVVHSSETVLPLLRNLKMITVLGMAQPPSSVQIGGQNQEFVYDANNKKLTVVNMNRPLAMNFTMIVN